MGNAECGVRNTERASSPLPLGGCAAFKALYDKRLTFTRALALAPDLARLNRDDRQPVVRRTRD